MLAALSHGGDAQELQRGEPGKMGGAILESSLSSPHRIKDARTYAFHGELVDQDELDAMIASLQSLRPLCSPEEARIRLSQNQ